MAKARNELQVRKFLGTYSDEFAGSRSGHQTQPRLAPFSDATQPNKPGT